MNNTNEPKWLDNAVFYEIYPQSFNDTNADGIGDINGITEKLDYIKDLGCNAIWINPCFKSPFGDAGYDVEDYYMVASRYGTNEDLANLFKEAHKRDMHILLDLVPGHTSVQHEWFKQSMKAEKNEFTDRYVWTDSIWEEPQGMGCIRGISDRDGSCAVNFFSHQPALNYGYYKPERPWQQSMDDEGPKATLEAMKDVMRFWLQMGADGFRVDMAGSLVKNDEDGKGTIKLWQNVREFLDKEFPNAAMVSEWGEPDKSLQGGFHSIMNAATIFLGLSVGATMTTEAFLNWTTIGIVIGGFLAFALSISGGILFVKIFNLFTKKKINPLIGACGLSAVPMASRVANEIALKYDPKNHVLQYCMASNISGVIGSAVAAGVLISFLG